MHRDAGGMELAGPDAAAPAGLVCSLCSNQTGCGLSISTCSVGPLNYYNINNTGASGSWQQLPPALNLSRNMRLRLACLLACHAVLAAPCHPTATTLPCVAPHTPPIPRHPTLPTFHSTPACPAVAPLSWDIVPEYDFFSEFATCEDEWATNNLAWFNTTTQACQMQPAGLLPNSFWNSGGFTSFTGIQVGGETVTGRPVDWSRAGRSCSCGELRRARTDHDPVGPP